jgi:DNA topoisomerase-1
MEITTLVPPPRVLARRARLRYTCDEDHGFYRVRRGRHFVYLNHHGRKLTDPRQLERIRLLAIPPAWTEVWICADARGHLQATGRDAKGRKQFVYHQDWQDHTSQTKFIKLRAFGDALPHIRRRIKRDLAQRRLSQQKVTAAVVELLDQTCVRVGNEEYAKANGSYGLTTLRDQHALIQGPRVLLRFQGKSGKLHQVEFRDRRVARIVQQCQDLPGQHLFQYHDEQGGLHRLESADVNRYLRSITGNAFTAKDFRTWKATAMVLKRLIETPPPESAGAANRLAKAAIREAAEELGNTVTVCRKYYVDPRVVQLFVDGKLADYCGPALPRAGFGLEAHERLLLKLLERLERRRVRPAVAA